MDAIINIRVHRIKSTLCNYHSCKNLSFLTSMTYTIRAPKVFATTALFQDCVKHLFIVEFHKELITKLLLCCIPIHRQPLERANINELDGKRVVF
ncbi:hypothetical protein CEXT_427711 [Caerostris extrusa]|uniref:Uncharacterized protein n=1 Tax=Caerostris extrusa TaxID=172846 RepID=A0AAV4YBV7_CAEEX|nr:hypothetical protein CEXT_427711 [Caerostris extrusa]